MDCSFSDMKPRTLKPVPLSDLEPAAWAVVQTALAYYDRGKAIQYDSTQITRQEKYAGGMIRGTDYCSPEEATADDIMFSVCSAYCFEVYYNVFRWKLLGDPLSCKTAAMGALPETDPIVAFRYHEDKGSEPDYEARLAAGKKILELARPGDLLIGNKATGHVMLYAGDCFGDGTNYLLHCWGGKYNMETGEDKWENDRSHNWEGGAIRRDRFEDVVLGTAERLPEGGTKPVWPIQDCHEFSLLRPLNILPNKDYPFTPSAIMRAQYPRLSVDRRADHDRFRDVEIGGTVTVTVRVTNAAAKSYSQPITVTEKIPACCSVCSVAGGGKLSGNHIIWTLKPLTAGQTAVCSYTVRVDGADAVRGRTVHFDGGSVGSLPSNAIAVLIGGRHLAPLPPVEEGDRLPENKSFALGFYEKYPGLAPAIPTLKQLEEKLFVPKTVPGASEPMLAMAEETDGDFALEKSMLVPTWFGGIDVWTASGRDRVLSWTEEQLVPGDVFLTRPGTVDLGVPESCVYLGNNTIACPGEHNTVTLKSAEELTKILTCGAFFSLRPTLAYDDIASCAVTEEEEEAVELDGSPEAAERAAAQKSRAKEKEAALHRQKVAQAEAEYRLRQAAVVETALAYWRRGEVQQYDSCEFTGLDRYEGGVRRATDHVSPEDATVNANSYFVCTSFAYNVYYEAIGYVLNGTCNKCGTAALLRDCRHLAAYYWQEGSGETVEEAVELIKRLLQPGDIIVGMKKTGHAMVYLGDCLGDGRRYVAHSWGGKYNFKTETEKHEKTGTIQLQIAEDLLFNREIRGIPRWCLYDNQQIAILRPLRFETEDTCPISSNARARLAHPGLNINRVADVCGYQTLPAGGKITYSVTVENTAKQAYKAILVTEKLPGGTTPVSCGGASLEGDTLHWLLDLQAGEKKTVSYTVQTGEETGPSVVSAGGSVAGIRSNTIVTHITKHTLTERENALLCGLASHWEGKLPGKTGMDFANALYTQYLSHPLALEEGKAFVARRFRKADKNGVRLIAWKEDADRTMVVPRYVGGFMLHTETAEERIMEFSMAYFRPGDILIYVTEPLTEQQTERVLVYLGDGAFAEGGEDGMTVTRQENIWQGFARDLTLCLRPGMI